MPGIVNDAALLIYIVMWTFFIACLFIIAKSWWINRRNDK